MKAFTTIGMGHGAPCHPVSKEDWIKARTEPALQQRCQQIASSTNEDEQSRLKAQLPVWTPRCAEFRNLHRAEKDAIAPLSRQMFDIDEKGHTDEILALMKPRESAEASENPDMYIGPFLILMVEESVRRGTHVLVEPPAGLSLSDAQALFSQLINLPVDPAVKNVAGCIYMVPDENVRYQSPRFFDIDECTAVHAENDPKAQTPTAAAEVVSAPRPTREALYPQDYDGIPYYLLVDALAEQLGGVPSHGSRNNFIFSMACHLRYICNDDPEWIAKVLPTYGEDSEKWRNTIRSACNRAQSRFVPPLVQRAISVAHAQVLQLTISTQPSSSDPLCASEPPALPTRLPALIRLLVSNVDPMYRAAVAQAVFPALGAHLHGVQARYIDNTINDLGGFMNILMAKQSIGKGSVNMPIDFIMEDICERDAYNREQEKEWKQQCKSAKANEKKPKRPEGLCVQYLMSNMTNAALVQRLIDAQAAGNKFLMVRLDEIELLNQLKATGGATASEIIRLAFTQSLYGQERVGHESVTGTPPLRFNFNASTTIPSGQAYFAKGLTNGTLSRLTFATIIKPNGKRGIPRFGNYDEKFRQKLRPYINNLNEASGLIECPQAERMARKLMDENYDIADLSDDDVFETLSYRANRIAYDKAMLLYIAQGYQWTKEIADFCRWSEQYDLWCKLKFFGESMRMQIKEEKRPATFGPRNMLDLLPDRFCKQDLQAVHRAQGNDGNVMQLIYNWTFRGYIELDTATQEYIKTPKYLAKHKKVQS